MELLAPAGSLEKLKAAVLFGADAVYLAGKSYGLRAFSDNFSPEEMQEGIAFAHSHGARVYVTVNIYARNQDLSGLPDYLRTVAAAEADAVIVSDPGVFQAVRRTIPQMPVHISTQANTTNWQAAAFWQELGASRVVLARELPAADIRTIHEQLPRLELEVFVHGAMCMSYSGRCLISNYLTGRDANQGACAQPCRWNYRLVEEKRPGEYYPLLEDERGSYIFNSKDLCLLEQIPLLHQSGVCSLKVEGRMKSVHYVASVIKIYREALDAHAADPANWQLRREWLQELDRISHREYTTGFFLGEEPGNQDAKINLGDNSSGKNHDFVGLVLDYDREQNRVLLEQRNHFREGDLLEFVPPQGPNFTVKAAGMTDEEGRPVAAAPHPQQRLFLPLSRAAAPWTMIRRA
ncbi:MAG: U32 family peptidase [Clostridiales bacterium]